MQERATDSKSFSISGAQRAPGVRAVDDEALQQHARDLLLDNLVLRLREQEQQHAREVVRVVVRVAQLVRHRVEQQVAPLRVQLRHQPLEHVHGRRLRDGRLPLRGLGLQLGNRLDAHVEHERVEQRHVVVRAARHRLVRGQQQALAQVGAEARGLARLQVVVHVLVEVLVAEDVLRLG
eukprot:827877-Prorocentrum_minimum.AAC.2